MGKMLSAVDISADDFFVDKFTGKYNFNILKIKDAHEWCLKATEGFMNFGVDVAVCNTFTQAWEYAPYLKLAKEKGYEPVIITVASKFKSIHDVPDDVMEKMRERFEYEPCFEMED